MTKTRIVIHLIASYLFLILAVVGISLGSNKILSTFNMVVCAVNALAVVSGIPNEEKA